MNIPRQRRFGHGRLNAGQPGFGLPDLLVIIAVICLLAALGMAMVTRGKMKASQARCTANLKDVTRAVLHYADDNRKVLPLIQSRQLAWWFYKEQVKGYLGLQGESSPKDVVFACPADRGYTDPGPFHLSKKFDYGSYVFNGVTHEGVPSLSGKTVDAIRQPEKTLLMMEWSAHAPLSWHKSRTGAKNHPFYNDAENVVGFVDGHVDFIKIHYDGVNAAYTRDPIPGYQYKYSAD